MRFGVLARRVSSAGFASVLLLTGAGLLVPAALFANHPVYVEGNCPLPTSRTNVPPLTCGDFDGDGLIGTAEDADGDRIFGTITGALGAASGGANQNGRVVIVTSGIFAETVTITGANGNVTLEAVPGVEANIDAVLAGDAGNAARQALPGIVVNAPAHRSVTLRNLVSRNWTEGIQVNGGSRVTIEDVRVEQNTNYGIHVSDTAKVSIVRSAVSYTGFRAGATGDFPLVNPPAPGNGIEFEDTSSGLVAQTAVTGSFGAGIKNSSSQGSNVRVNQVYLFDNNPDTSGGIGGSGSK